MRILDVSSATISSLLPVKTGTLQFIQDAWNGNDASQIIGRINNYYSPGYNTSVPWMLNPVIAINLGSSTSFSAGTIFYQGEILDVPAQTVTNPSGSNVFIMNVSTAQYTSDADVTTFSDGVTHNIHNIRTVSIATGLTGTGTLPDFLAIIDVFSPFLFSATSGSGFTVNFKRLMSSTYLFSAFTTVCPMTVDMTGAIAGSVVNCQVFGSPSTGELTSNNITTTGSQVDGSVTLPSGIPTSFVLIRFECLGGNIFKRDVIPVA